MVSVIVPLALNLLVQLPETGVAIQKWFLASPFPHPPYGEDRDFIDNAIKQISTLVDLK